MLKSRRIISMSSGALHAPASLPRSVGGPRIIAAVVVCLLAVLGTAANASAAPITINLRVEGSDQTLFEGPVSTSAETIETPSSAGPHPCDYTSNGSAGGFADEGNPSGTPTTALHDAALASGLAFDATWFGTAGGNPGDFFVTKVGPDANESTAPFASWGFAVNDTTAPVGGCQIALAPGSEVLWAYNYFNLSHLLSLSAPSTVSVGAAFPVHVGDGHTGEPISGATIDELRGGVTTPLASSPLTDANGNATISLPQAGSVTLKAIRADSVRSNGVGVCAHAGNDGSCGTSGGGSASTPSITVKSTQPAVGDVARVLGIRSGWIYARGGGPRILRGAVTVGTGGTLRQVRIRLQRRNGGRCFNFSGSREQFVHAPKCPPAAFFSVGDSESFSYLLPARLPAGRYTYDIQALDSAGRVTALVGGVDHVIFRVK